MDSNKPYIIKGHLIIQINVMNVKTFNMRCSKIAYAERGNQSIFFMMETVGCATDGKNESGKYENFSETILSPIPRDYTRHLLE